MPQKLKISILLMLTAIGLFENVSTLFLEKLDVDHTLGMNKRLMEYYFAGCQ